MADYVSTIELKAMTGDLQRKLSKVNSSLKGVSRQVEKTQGAFKRMTVKATSSFAKLDAAVARHKGKILGLAASVGALGVAGVVAFKKWEEGLAQIETLGVTGISNVAVELKKLRREYGITGAEATKGYYDIISAGAKQGAEALDRMTAATKLAVAGNTDLAGAVDIVTSTINLFGKQGETATSIVDKIFLAVKYGKTTVQELGQAWGFVAPVAAAAGLSLDELAAAMAGVTAGGIKTKQATTGMKAVISNIAKVTPKAAAAAKAAGIEFNLQALHTKGLVGVMRDLQKATGGSIEELLKFFESTEAAGAVAALLSNLDAMEATTNAMADSFGTVDEALKKVQKTFGNRWNIFSQQMSIASETIGGSLVPSLTAMLEVVGPIVDFIAAIILQHPGIVKVTVAVTAFAAAWALMGGKAAIAITGVIYVLTKIAKHFDLFSEGGAHAFNVVTAAWHNFVLGIKQSTLGKTISTIWTGLTDNMPSFNLSGLLAGDITWSEFFTPEGYDSFSAYAKEKWGLIKAATAKHWATFYTWFRTLSVGGINFGEAIDSISTFFNDLWIDAVVAWDSFTIWWDTLSIGGITWYDITSAVKSWFSDLSDYALSSWNTFKVWWAGLNVSDITWDSTMSALKSWFNDLRIDAEVAWDSFTIWWDKLDLSSITWADVKNGITDWFDKLLVAGETAWADFKVWWTGLTIFGIDVSAAFSNMVDYFVSGFIALKNSAIIAWGTFKVWWEDLTIAGINVSEVFTDLADWFVSSFITLKTKASEAWVTFKDWWEDLTIAGIDVSEVFDDLIDNIKAGFTLVEDAASTAWDTFKVWWDELEIFGIDVSDIFDSLADDISAGFTSVKDNAKSAWDTFKLWWDGLEIAGIDVSAMFTGVYDSAVQAFDDTVAYIKDIPWISSIFSGISDGIQAVKDWFYDLWVYLVGESVVPDIVKDINAAFKELTFVQIIEAMVAKAEALFDRLFKAVSGNDTATGDLIPSVERDFGTLNTIVAAVTTAITGFQGALNQIDLSRLQKAIQASRNLEASISDDLGKTISTDKATSSRAFENAGKGRASLRTEQIKSYRALGREIGKAMQKGVNAEMDKMIKNLEGQIKPRGFLSRFLFGSETQLTWKEKFIGLLNQINKGFKNLGNTADRVILRLQALSASAKTASATKVFDRVTGVGIDGKKLGNTFEKGGTGKSVPIGAQGTTKVKADLINKAELKLNQAKANQLTIAINQYHAQIRKELKALEKAQKAQLKLTGTRVESAELLKQATDNVKAARTKNLTELRKLEKAIRQSIKDIKAEAKGTTKKPEKFKPVTPDKAVKAAGVRKFTTKVPIVYETLVNSLSRISAYVGKAAATLGKFSGLNLAASSLGTALKSISQGRVFRSVKFIAGKVLIPLVAAYDAFKGFTDLGRISEITGIDTSAIQDAEKNLYAAESVLDTMNEGTRMFSAQQEKIAALAATLEQAEGDTGLTTGTRAISAASNAIGNFISGFAWLGGIVAGWIGLDETAKVLEDVDLAPSVRKLFDTLGKLGKTIGNLLGLITGGEGSGFVDGTISAAFSIIINTIVGAIDIINQIAVGLEALSRGDLQGVWTAMKRMIDTLVNYFKAPFVSGSFDDLQEEDQRRYASEDAIRAQERAEEVSKQYTDALALLEEGTDDYQATQVLAIKAQEALNVASRNAAAALENFKLEGKRTVADGESKGAAQARIAAEQAAIKASIAAPSTIGEIRPDRFATGGSISGAGTGTSDSIPAMLSNGEYVINAKSAAQNRILLEAINSGKIKGYAEGGAVAGQRYDFVQAQTQGTGNLLEETVIDWVTVFENTVGTLEVGGEKFKKLSRLFDDARDNTTNMNYEQAKSEGVIRDFNKGVIEAGVGVTAFDEATADAAGAITATAEAIAKTVATNDWEGTFSSFTDPLKRAAIEGGNFADALKEGAKNLFETIAGKLMDRAMKPLEDAMDMLFNDMFGSVGENDGSSAANALYVQITEGLGGIFSQNTNAIKDTTKAVLEGTASTATVFAEEFSNFGSFFTSSGAGSNVLGGLMGGGDSGVGSTIGGFISSLFGMAKGGIVPKPGMQPQYFASGGMAKGTDTVPAMLTPGEMVLNKDQQDMLGGSNTYNTYNLDISGNVDQRAIEQIRNIIQNSPNQVNQASNRGERERTGLRQSNRR